MVHVIPAAGVDPAGTVDSGLPAESFRPDASASARAEEPAGYDRRISAFAKETAGRDRRILTQACPAAAIIGPCGVEPRAVALFLAGEDQGASLTLLDSEDRPLLVLGPYPEEEAVAAWRRLGQASGLPLAIQGPDGILLVPYPQLGRVLLGPVRARRLHALLAGRRPRFLARRKAARFPRRPRVFREAEMAAGLGD